MNSRVQQTLLLTLAVSAFLFVPAFSSCATESLTYVYDDLNRLVRVDYSDRFMQCVYDELGDRETKSVQSGTPSSYSLSSSSQTLYETGGIGMAYVTAGSSSPWTASSDASWITLTSGSSGTGNGSLSYTVAPCSVGGIRTGTISVAGQLITVTQVCSDGGHDFNGDGKPDILWRNTLSGYDAVWMMDGVTMLSSVPLDTVDPQTGWTIAAVGDFNGDGKPDILWRNTLSGYDAVWMMDGVTMLSSVPLDTVDPQTGWTIAAVGDFNGDGKPDILWRNTLSGYDAVWMMDGVTMLSSVPLDTVDPQTGWTIAAVGDFNGDGKPDILWRNTLSGYDAVWMMDGVTMLSSVPLDAVDPQTGWTIAAVGDFNGDGKPDILLRNTLSGYDAVWMMDGVTMMSSVPLDAVDPQTGWTIAAVGDFNGDGKPDILLRNTLSGYDAVWMMDGVTMMSSVPLQTVDPQTGWTIVGK